MTYAGSRAILDADSHVMELGGFLDEFFDPDAARAAAPRRHRGARAGARPGGQPGRRPARPIRPAPPRPRSGCSTTRAGTRSAPSTVTNGAGCSTCSASGASWCSRRSRRRCSPAATSTGSTAGAGRRTWPWRDFCATDDRLFSGRVRAARRPGTGDVATAREAIEAGCRAIMVPSTAAGERAPTHPDLDPFWDAALRDGRAVRAPRGWWRSAARPCVPQQRHAGHRPPRRWGERALEGLPRDPTLTGALPRGADLRRPLRPVPGASRRVHRAGRRLGCVVAAGQLDVGQRSFRRTEPPLQRLESHARRSTCAAT